MQPRVEPLTIPDSERYFAVDLGDKGVHHFRLPDFTAPHIISEFASKIRHQRRADQAMLAGLALGLCWYHRAYELETEPPEEETARALRAYSRAVQGELVDAGYTNLHLLQMLNPVLRQVKRFVTDEPAEVAATLGNGDAEGTAPSASSS